MITFKKMLIFWLSITVLSGCASSAELSRQAALDAKAADYYQSIGQPGVAEKNRKMAQDNYKEAISMGILVDILTVIFSDE